MGLFNFRKGKRARADSQKNATQQLAEPRVKLYTSSNIALFRSTPATTPQTYGESISIHSLDTALMNHHKPWSHRIIFGGATLSEARNFCSGLSHRFQNGPTSKNSSYQEIVDWLLNDLALTQWEHKEFHSPRFRVHELRQKLSGREWSETIKRETVEYAMKSSRVLEFGYVSAREYKEGARRETHVHRILVTHMDSSGFRGQHARGTRRYSWSRVMWAGVDVSHSEIPQPEPYAILDLYPRKIFPRLELALDLGTLGHRGKLVGEISSSSRGSKGAF